VRRTGRGAVAVDDAASSRVNGCACAPGDELLGRSKYNPKGTENRRSYKTTLNIDILAPPESLTTDAAP
jgi:hypothetical protein